MCPSRGRPGAARETLDSFLATRKDKGSRIVFVVDSDDPTLSEYPAGYVHTVKPTGCMGEALQAATTRDVLEDATSVGMIGDDNRFRTKGWDRILDRHLSENIGVAYGDDGFQHERLPTAWWVSRPLVDIFGIAPKGLRHLYMDNWWKSLAEGAGCLTYFPDVSIEHLHPHVTEGANWLQSAKADATYKRGNSRDNARSDRNTYDQWVRKYRNEDVKKARRLIAGEKRRVLADWHHPALWESLAILFEDRFGWELVSMGGEDWTNHGWLLGAATPIEWTAADYLSLDGAKLVGDHYERTTPEYPKRTRKQMTPEQALGQKWDFVLGSVPIHQRTFPELARKVGGRFVHQIGNAKHRLDPVPQIILSSTSAPFRARLPHVTYHQEFDRSLFRYSEPTDPFAVTSLMLRLDWTSCDYSWLVEDGRFKWSAIGGAGMDAKGYLTPMSKVAERIAASGWIWHDKRIGDGYGHVLHNAAAMGRPLIGHGSHYRGMLGEPFWQDMKTCIDLDLHPPKEALRLLHAISSDPDWYADMSRGIADVFDETVDFPAEAEAIRALLTY